MDQKWVYRSWDASRWGTLNLVEFNATLLGKWWYKLLSEASQCGTSIIQFNYLQYHKLSNLFQSSSPKRSFFWGGILSYLPAFQTCLSHTIHNGTSMLFQLNHWVGRHASYYLWADVFAYTPYTFGIMKDIILDFIHILRKVDLFIDFYLTRLNSNSINVKLWCLTSNGCFTQISFYNFLINIGIQC